MSSLEPARNQRRTFIVSRAYPQGIALGEGWQVRRSFVPGRQRHAVGWTAPVVGRRRATVIETMHATFTMVGWPVWDPSGLGFSEPWLAAWLLELADGETFVAPSILKLQTQRIRTPARVAKYQADARRRALDDRWFHL